MQCQCELKCVFDRSGLSVLRLKRRQRMMSFNLSRNIVVKEKCRSLKLLTRINLVGSSSLIYSSSIYYGKNNCLWIQSMLTVSFCFSKLFYFVCYFITEEYIPCASYAILTNIQFGSQQHVLLCMTSYRGRTRNHL